MTTDNSREIILSEQEKNTIAQTFSDVKDFREVGEAITAPIDDVINEVQKIIETDPVMDVSDTLSKVNNDVNVVYEQIIANDGAIISLLKSIPLLWKLVKSLQKNIKNAHFDMHSASEQIAQIFEWFDISYTSLNTSIDMQKIFLNGLDENLEKVVAYRQFVNEKLSEFSFKKENVSDEKELARYNMFQRNIEYFLWNLDVLIGNLQLAKKRLLVRLDAATKLSLAMNASKPIFKTLLSVAIIEVSGQKALDASAKVIEKMGSTIDSLSSELTDKTIEASKKSEELSRKPILDEKKFIANVQKLQQHFDDIESYREIIKKEAEEERKIFAQATEDLRKMQLVQKEDYHFVHDVLVDADQEESE